MVSFNRTFMELKVLYQEHTQTRAPVSIEPLWNWKHWFVVYLQCKLKVSIEPLWNWKHKIMCKVKYCASFNRTFMELKVWLLAWSWVAAAVSIEPLWNWKRMSTWKYCKNVVFQSNLYGIESVQQIAALFSAPKFQSNLYGIESLLQISGVMLVKRFQSNLYGIESTAIAMTITRNAVSIEPLWNWKFNTDSLCKRSLIVSIEPLWNWKDG